jgi:hypothetical protein
MVGAVNVSRVFAISVALLAAALLVYRHRDDLRRTPASNKHEQSPSA